LFSLKFHIGFREDMSNKIIWIQFVVPKGLGIELRKGF